jgi:hypothetical protein
MCIGLCLYAFNKEMGERLTYAICNGGDESDAQG